MKCTQCDREVASNAKFCSECGSPVRTGETSPNTQTASNSTYTAVSSLVEAVFGSDGIASKKASQEIIANIDIPLMADCARRALLINDPGEANFWFDEWITAPQVSEDRIAEGVHAFSSELLIPSNRFSEAELYLTWLSHSSEKKTASRATSTLQDLHRTRGAKGFTRYHSDGSWRSVDVSLPLDPSWSAQKQYERTLAWLVARVEAGDLEEAMNRHDPLHLSHICGLVNGMRDSIARIGGDWEATVQAVIDWVDFETKSIDGAAAAAAASAVRSLQPKPVVGQATSRSVPTENSLGNHVDKIFPDRKLASQIRQALGCTSGVNDDFIVAAIPVSNKLGDATDFYDQYMVFTKLKVAIVKKSGMFSSGFTECFPMSQVSFVGIGESDHYEAQGFSGRSTAWVSITLELKGGQHYTRHFFLGHDESEVNSSAPEIRGDLERMGRVGWPIGDGPAWNSSGGYRTSYGYGIAFWN